MPIKSEFEDVEVATEPFSKTFLDAIWKHFVENPARPALINAKDESDRVTYGELYLYCHAVATFLEGRGFGHKDTCCTVLPNCWQFLTIMIGVGLQGGTASPASHMFTQYELQQQFKDSRSKIVFCSDINFQQVLNAVKNVPSISTIVVMSEERGVRNPLPHTGNIAIVHYDDLLTASQPQALMPHKKAHIHVEKDVFLLPYSSGTTGSPKGVMISHKNVGTMREIQDKHMKRNVLPYVDPNYHATKEYNLMILPFYHIYGLVMSTSTVMDGTTLIFMRGFDPHLFCSTIQKYRIRTLMLVPPILVFLAKNPIADQYDLSSVIFIFTGAAPAGRDLCLELVNKYKNLVTVAQGYGMTELSLGSLFPSLKDGKDRYESSGKLISNFEMKIVDVDTGRELGTGEPGELYFRGPTVMMGYFGRPDATAETIDPDGWLRSGDIGILDEDGFVQIVDRRKELIKVKGYQVPPAELEDLLLTHPRVRDCAVIGVPDGQGGEQPKAFVVRADRALSQAEVLAFVKERVAHYKQLKGGVEFVEEIPKSPSGKILRRFLRDKSQKDAKSKL